MDKKKTNKIVDLLKRHVVQNYKEYLVIMVFFIIGLFFGVFFINQMKEEQISQVHDYLNGFVQNLKNTSDINEFEVLKSSIFDKILLTLAIWFFGTTVVGIPVVFGLVIYRGFCLGYTIASIISFMGFTKGFFFILIILVLQNILLIPALMGLAVSGFKFYKSIIKDRRKETIKIAFARHTIFSIFMLIGLVISSFVEVFVSTKLLTLMIQYF